MQSQVGFSKIIEQQLRMKLAQSEEMGTFGVCYGQGHWSFQSLQRIHDEQLNLYQQNPYMASHHHGSHNERSYVQDEYGQSLYQTLSKDKLERVGRAKSSECSVSEQMLPTVLFGTEHKHTEF